MKILNFSQSTDFTKNEEEDIKRSEAIRVFNIESSFRKIEIMKLQTAVAQKLEPKSPDLRRLKRRKNLKLKTSNPQSLRRWKFKSKMLLLPSRLFVWSNYAIQFEKTENTHFRFPSPPLSSIFHGYFGRQSCTWTMVTHARQSENLHKFAQWSHLRRC